MNNRTVFADLRDILAALYTTQDDARRVTKDAGLNELHIAFSAKPINNWDAILGEAEKTSQVDALIRVVCKEYSSNQDLISAVNAYYSNQAKGCQQLTSTPQSGSPEPIHQIEPELQDQEKDSEPKTNIPPYLQAEENTRRELEVLPQFATNDEVVNSKEKEKIDSHQKSVHQYNLFWVFLMAAAVLMIIWLIGGTIAYWSATQFKSYSEALWWASMVILDPGNANSCQGFMSCTVGLSLAFVGLIMYGGIIVSIIVAILNSYFENLAEKAQNTVYSIGNSIRTKALSLYNRRHQVIELWKKCRDLLSYPQIVVPSLIAIIVIIIVLGLGKLFNPPRPIVPPPTISSEPPLTPLNSDCDPQKPCIRILIASLNTPKFPDASKVFNVIQRKINDVKAKLDEQDSVTPQYITVKWVEGKSITEMVQATRLVHDEKATLLIWGNIPEFPTRSQMEVNFTLNDGLDIGGSTNVRPFRVHPLDFETFALPIELTKFGDIVSKTNHIDIIALTAIGLANYTQGREERVVIDLVNALHCLGETIEISLQIYIVPSVCNSSDTDNLPAQMALNLLPQLHYYIGKALVLQGSYKLGIDYLEQARKFFPTDPAILASLGQAYLGWTGGVITPDAFEAFRQAIISAKNSVGNGNSTTHLKALIDLGLIWIILGDYPKAQEYLEQAHRFLKINNAQSAMLVEVSFLLADTQQKNNEWENAKATLEQAQQSMAESHWLLLAQAQLYQDGDPDQSQKLLEQAETVAPHVAYIDIIKAELYLHWQKYDEVPTVYDSALRKRPQSGWLITKIGNFYAFQQKWEKAKEQYKEAQYLSRNDPYAYERLSYSLLQLEQFKAAILSYNQAIKLAYPQYIPAQFYCNKELAEQKAGFVTEAKESKKQCEKWKNNNTAAQENAKKLRSQLDELYN